MSEPSPATAAYAPPESAAALVRVLDDYFAALQAGQAPDRAEVLARHPNLAAQMESCLAALDFIHQVGRPAAGEAPARLGDFLILGELGRGGMGVVYEAEQLSLKRKVALKVLRFGGTADPSAMDRFRREAETVARLHHTNIVPVFAVGCVEDVHYYAMQLIDGEGLDRAAARLKPDSLTVARWGMQAAEALAHAHARGVIHRDIKPSNLLLDREGIVWLTDFGLARRSDEAALTLSGVLMGTPRYMSPEQAAATQQPIDARSDVYSLGATLYELTTGRPVHDGETPQRVLAQILQEEPVPPRRHNPDLPRDLETVLLKCLARDPRDRYATTQDLADDLRRFVNGDPVKARRPSLRERFVRWAKKHRRQAALIGATALLSVGLAVLAATAWVRHREWALEQERIAYEESLGQVALTALGPPLLADVFDADGRLVRESVPVPTRDFAKLPEGTYHLRLTGPWRPTRQQEFTVAPGSSIEVAIPWAGQVVFTTDGPPLVAEVLDADGQPVVPAFPVPSDGPVTLPAGDYRVRLRGPWLPVESVPLTVEAGSGLLPSTKPKEERLRLIGRLSLDTHGPPLQAEVLDDKGNRVVPAFTLPTPDPVALPAGEHTLRLSQRGFWSESAALRLGRGEALSYTLDLGERKLFDPVPVEGRIEVDTHGDLAVIRRAGRAELVQLTAKGLRRFDPVGGKERWLVAPQLPVISRIHTVGLPDGWLHFFGERGRSVGDNDPEPHQARLVRPEPDLDGDGEPDLVWASRHVPSLLAVSGKTGQVLWWHGAELPLPKGMEANVSLQKEAARAAGMGMPLLVDVDGDGTPDVLAVFEAVEGTLYDSAKSLRTDLGHQVWAEAVSGKTGRTVWQAVLEQKPPGNRTEAKPRPFLSWTGRVDGKSLFSVLAGRKLVFLDPATGKFLRPAVDLGFDPVGVPRLLPGARPAVLVGRNEKDGAVLVAVGLADGQVLWSRPLGFPWPEERSRPGDTGSALPNPAVPPPEWPVVADLDGDGLPEILVPAPQWREGKQRACPGGGAVVLDGATGRPRWEFRFPDTPTDLGWDTHAYVRLAVLPDRDRDGRRDVVVARLLWIKTPGTTTAGYRDVAVAVLAGANGKLRWRQDRRWPTRDTYPSMPPDLGRLSLWTPGLDDMPLLVVPTYPDNHSHPDVLLLESGSGRFVRELPQFGEPGVEDFDGNGLPDLYAFRPAGTTNVLGSSPGSFVAVAGRCPDRWRRVQQARVVDDHDGDGTPDLLLGLPRERNLGPSRLELLSGRANQVLWRSEVVSTEVTPLRTDLDGDGCRDLLSVVEVPHADGPEIIVRPVLVNGKPAGESRSSVPRTGASVVAISGKTGRKLWASPGLFGTLGGDSVGVTRHLDYLDVVSLRDGGPPVVVGLSRLYDNRRLQAVAYALSATDGRPLWLTPVGPVIENQGYGGAVVKPAFVDLDGDGTRDLLFWAPSLKPGDPRPTLCALNGATGKLMWERLSPQSMRERGYEHVLRYPGYLPNAAYPAPAAADLEGNGRALVVIPERQDKHERLIALDGADGKERWHWDGPDVFAGSWTEFEAPQPFPRVVRLKAGTFVVAAVHTWPVKGDPAAGPRPRQQLILLDGKGQVREKRTFFTWNHSAYFPLWVADLDGDGFDEMVFFDGLDSLAATRNGVVETLWKMPWKARRVLAVRPASGGSAGVVVTQSGSRVQGYHAVTGRPLWACDGPTEKLDLLPAKDPLALPDVVYHWQQTTVCRRAVPVGPEGIFQTAKGGK